MYNFSRTIYRQLAPLVVEDWRDPRPGRNKQAVLDACESAIRRLTYDGRYFARPARSLFREIRPHFKMSDQLHVWRVVEQNMNLAVEFVSRFPSAVTLDGEPPHCHAYTRRGDPCQRTPLPGRDYCPSHKYLEDPFEEFDLKEPFEELERPAAVA
jgi:hypothetical protein